MNKKVKAKWLDALRSGRYKQGKHYLRTTTEQYCCLGVLCDIINPQGWTKHTVVYSNNGDSQTVPKSVAAEIGLSSEMQAKLANMNDFKRCSFDTIADYIEVNL